MNFQETEAYLYSLGNEVETMKLGLENITALLEVLGQPHTKYKKVQVAGTNGKGSVCAFLNSICLEAGIKTGLYTSPHLTSIRERIKIDGRDISEKEFARTATQVRDTAERLLSEGELAYRPTFFEQVTAIALLAFAEHRVDLATLETGLGGRFDATTAANAEIGAITRIDLDHQEYLGDTIEQIAAEKAAIIRPDSKVVILHQSKHVERVLVGRCREVGIDPKWASTDIRITEEPSLLPAISGSICTPRDNYTFLEFCGMLGRHQFENASIAIAVAELLRDSGLGISKEQIVDGLESAKHPGRLEYLQGVLLDGAHNAGGALALRRFLDEAERRPVTLVFGAMRDKKVREIADIIWPRAEKIVLTQPSNPRAMTADELAALTPSTVDPANVIRTQSVLDGIEKAREIASPDSLIVVTGSLYLVGEIRQILLGRQADESDAI